VDSIVGRMNAEAIAKPRAPGRPGRISHQQIVAETLAMLEADGLAGFSLARLARCVGVTPMALYNYFPSRDALLDAAAKAMFDGFEIPASEGNWESRIRAWLEALRDLIRRYPVSLQIIRWDDHIAPSWIKIWLPMAQTLEAEGLQGEKLAFALRWLIQAAMGVIQSNLETRQIARYEHEVDDPNLVSDGDLIAQVFAHVDTVRAEDIFQFEVQNIVFAVRRLIEK
jgi:TetR/AcrR family tetracycline transcriptional repressor